MFWCDMHLVAMLTAVDVEPTPTIEIHHAYRCTRRQGTGFPVSIFYPFFSLEKKRCFLIVCVKYKSSRVMASL